MAVDLRGFYLKVSPLTSSAVHDSAPDAQGLGSTQQNEHSRHNICSAQVMVDCMHALFRAADQRRALQACPRSALTRRCVQLGQFFAARAEFVPLPICRSLSRLHDQVLLCTWAQSGCRRCVPATRFGCSLLVAYSCHPCLVLRSQ